MITLVFVSAILNSGIQAQACEDYDLNKIHKSISVIQCNGDIAKGTWDFDACTEDLATGCLATEDFPAVNIDHIKPEYLAVGYTLADVVGTFPQMSATETAPSSYAAKVEFKGVKGTVLTNCRDTAELSIYDNVTKPSSVGIDPGDTIEGYLSGTRRVGTAGPWGEDFVCLFGDHWRDDSKNAAGDPTTCTETSDDCVFTDTSAGIMWSEENPGNAIWNFATASAGDWPCGSAGCTMNAERNQITSGGGSGAYTAAANLRWWDAVYACNQLNFAGFNDWRLPSAKELLNSAIHGLGAVENAEFMTKTTRYWTSTSEPTPIGRDTFVWISSGHAADYLVATKWKSDAYAFQCIRNLSD